MKKSISPVIAVILLIVIAVGLAASTYLFISNQIQTLLTTSEEQATKAMQITVPFKAIIYNPNSYDLTDYQVKIDISPVVEFYKTQLIRVLDEKGNPINFCYEQPNGECNTTPTDVIWVKVPFIPANGETYLIITKSGTNHAVNGEEVFDFYDDFKTLDTNKWIVSGSDISISNSIITLNTDCKPPGSALRSTKLWTSGNYIVEVKVVSHTSYVRFFIGFENNFYDYDDGGPYWWGLRVDGKKVNSWGYNVPPNGLVGKVSLIVAGKTILDDPSTYTPVEWVEYSTNLGRLYLKSWFTSSISIDWVRVRKYADGEPRIRIQIS